LGEGSGSGGIIDIGSLAQCLVFYRKTRIIVGQVTFGELVRRCGVEELLQLCGMGALEIEFFQSLTAVLAKPIRGTTFYDNAHVKSESLRYQHTARKLFTQLAGPSGKGANKNYNRFDKVVLRSDNTPEMLAQARLDWMDTTYLEEAMKAIISLEVPSYVLPKTFSVTVTKHDEGLDFRTSLNLNEVDAAYRAAHPGAAPTITPSHILVRVADARRALQVGSRLSSEFAVSPTQGRILETKFRSILERSIVSSEAATAFHESAVEGLPTIRDAVNSGQKSFADVVRLVEKAERFKSWLTKQEPSEDLRQSYLRDVAHIDWAEKMPPKTLRWLVITGAGLGLGATTHPIIGAAVGTVLSAADAFLLDKLIKGWKPSQFIEGSLKPFLE
jgi:hypothetical protein